MAGAAISGYAGDVKIGSTSIIEITKWSFNPKINVSKYASNKTSGYKAAVPGVRDGSGTAEGKWVGVNPVYTTVYEGLLATLNLYIDAVSFWAVPSCIESFKIDVDLDNGEIVGWSADFQTNGAWTAPAAGLTFDPELIVPGSEGMLAPDLPLQKDGVPMTPEELMKQEAAMAAQRASMANRTPKPFDREAIIADAVERAVQKSGEITNKRFDEINEMLSRVLMAFEGKTSVAPPAA